MARKTTKAMTDLIRVHNNQRNSIVQRSGFSTAEKIAALQSLNIMVETMLLQANCYWGFNYVNRSGGIIYDLEPYYRSSSTSPHMRVLPPETEYCRAYIIK